jgi:phage terminase small subunit
MPKLTERQRKFATNLARQGNEINRAQAAREAGYSAVTAGGMGAALARDPRVIELVAKLREELS